MSGVVGIRTTSAGRTQAHRHFGAVCALLIAALTGCAGVGPEGRGCFRKIAETGIYDGMALSPTGRLAAILTYGSGDLVGGHRLIGNRVIDTATGRELSLNRLALYPHWTSDTRLRYVLRGIDAGLKEWDVETNQITALPGCDNCEAYLESTSGLVWVGFRTTGGGGGHLVSDLRSGATLTQVVLGPGYYNESELSEIRWAPNGEMFAGQTATGGTDVIDGRTGRDIIRLERVRRRPVGGLSWISNREIVVGDGVNPDSLIAIDVFSGTMRPFTTMRHSFGSEREVSAFDISSDGSTLLIATWKPNTSEIWVANLLCLDQ